MTDLITEADVRIIASEKNSIEGETIRQLKTTAKLPDMMRAVGLPDLHPGWGHLAKIFVGPKLREKKHG
jgi:RNA-splicing ligase RtcB